MKAWHCCSGQAQTLNWQHQLAKTHDCDVGDPSGRRRQTAADAHPTGDSLSIQLVAQPSATAHQLSILAKFPESGCLKSNLSLGILSILNGDIRYMCPLQVSKRKLSALTSFTSLVRCCSLSLHTVLFHGSCYVEYSLSRATMLLSTTRSHEATSWSQHEKDKVASVTSGSKENHEKALFSSEPLTYAWCQSKMNLAG